MFEDVRIYVAAGNRCATAHSFPPQTEKCDTKIV